MGNDVMIVRSWLSGGRADSRIGVLRFSSLIVAGALALSACSQNTDTNAFLDPTEPADKVYNEALANVDAGNYTEARKKFKKVDRQHPYSEFAKKSVVMDTYISYKEGNYPEAIASGRIDDLMEEVVSHFESIPEDLETIIVEGLVATPEMPNAQAINAAL